MKLNCFNKNKIFTFYEDAKELAKGEIQYPRMALIYPTYACNYKCPHCLYRNMRNYTDHLPYDRFRSLIDELKKCGVKAIEFCGGGEPTLYPQFAEIVEYIVDKGIQFGILTNGSMLGKYHRLLIDKASYIRVSVDTTKQWRYDKLHHPPAQHNLKSLSNDLLKLARYRGNRQQCVIGIKSLISQDNRDEIIDLCNFAKNHGADYIQFKGLRGTNREIPEHEKEVLQHHIDKLNDPFIKGDIRVSRIKQKCFMSPIHTMIDAFGDVYICCYYQYRNESHFIGNVLFFPFEDIWFSKRHKDMINNIKTEECNVYDCRFHYYNKVMKEVVEDGSYHINFI